MDKLNIILNKFSPFNFVRIHSNTYYYKAALSDRKTKRGAMLSKMLVNKDKNKTWHFNIMKNAPNAKSVFERIHRPTKRQNVLDSLFIKNITDVLSTGDVVPEIIGYGVEITGVKISPCCQTLNVYWQIPPNSFKSHEEIAVTLNSCAPRLRAELISRNVLGKVPHIFFIRDITNARLADFENALKDADLGPERELSVVPDDQFTKKIYCFKTSKGSETNREKEMPKLEVSSKKSSLNSSPDRPPNMKCDVFGLNRDAMMQKVVALRTKTPSQNSAVVASEFFPSADLFDNIPGTPMQIGSDREQILNQFRLQRKMLRTAKYNFKLTKEDCLYPDGDADVVMEDNAADREDYVEEETTEKPF